MKDGGQDAELDEDVGEVGELHQQVCIGQRTAEEIVADA